MLSRTPRTWVIRSCALLASAALVIVSAPGSASAEEDRKTYVGADFRVRAVAIGVGEATEGKTARLDVYAYGAGELPEHASVQVDVAGAANVLVATVIGDKCTVSGTVTTCDVALPNAGDPDGSLQINLKVASAAHVGDWATLKVSVSADGAESSTSESRIQVVASSADLVAKSFTAATARPGDVRTYQPTFRNSGDATASYVGIRISDEDFARFTSKFSNCRYRNVNRFPGYCEFKLDLAPGETARVSAETPISVMVQPNAPNQGRTGSYYTLEVSSSPLQDVVGAWGDGPELKLEKVANTGVRALVSDADWNDNHGYLTIPTGANPADVVAVGATVTMPASGPTVVKVGLTNNGPAFVGGALDGEGLSPDAPHQPAAMVTLPAGVTVVSVQNGEEGTDSGTRCAPVVDGKADWTKRGVVLGSVYRCTANRNLDAGESEFAEFGVTMTGTATLVGSVVVAGGDSDPDLTNNKADITFVPATGTVPVVVGDPPATGTVPVVVGDPPAAGTVPVVLGTLPVTGTNVTVAAGAGFALLIAGFALYRVSRRRRIILVADEI